MARIATVTALASVFCGLVLATNFAEPLHAQNATVDDLKGKIAAAKMAQQGLGRVLPHCTELNGTNFYFQQRDRVLSLEDYHRALDNLARQGSFNPETKQPWNQKDADARWTQAQKQAAMDKTNCELVASLPALQKQLQALQQQTGTSPSNPAANRN